MLFDPLIRLLQDKPKPAKQSGDKTFAALQLFRRRLDDAIDAATASIGNQWGAMTEISKALEDASRAVKIGIAMRRPVL